MDCKVHTNKLFVNFSAHNLMWPIFVVDDPDDKQAIASMPGEKY